MVEILGLKCSPFTCEGLSSGAEMLKFHEKSLFYPIVGSNIHSSAVSLLVKNECGTIKRLQDRPGNQPASSD